MSKIKIHAILDQLKFSNSHIIICTILEKLKFGNGHIIIHNKS